MTPSAITRLRNLHSDNKLVLSLLGEIEVLVRTNKLLQGELDRDRREKKRQPATTQVDVPWLAALPKTDSQIFELPNP